MLLHCHAGKAVTDCMSYSCAGTGCGEAHVGCVHAVPTNHLQLLVGPQYCELAHSTVLAATLVFTTLQRDTSDCQAGPKQVSCSTASRTAEAPQGLQHVALGV